MGSCCANRPFTRRRFAARLLLAVPITVLGATQAGTPPSNNPVADVLRQRLGEMRSVGRAETERSELSARAALPILYEKGAYQPFWSPARLETLQALLRESAQDGLRPEDYHAAELASLAPELADPGTDPQARARIDLIATDAFYLLLYHLYLGKVDPKTLDANWNFEPRPIGNQGGIPFVLDALTSGRLREAVERVRPDYWWYKNARAALAEYRGLAERGGWETIPAGPTLKPGMKGPRVVALRRRLAVTGELPGPPLDSETFDEPLAAAVREFQKRHRLSADGVVAAGTLAELNVPVEKRVLQIRINLERARWVLGELTDVPLVIVDVAGFEVAYRRDGQVIWKSKVQIGKPYRQTPIFKSKIDQVVFNPTWTVPPGILAKDVLPAAKRDPGYFQRKGFDLFDRNGRKVDPSTVNWAVQTAARFPYSVVQPPGPDNSLGSVKILFPNPYFVYLHDTPHKEHFQETARAFSSGCMRVERPLELAELVLNDSATWNAQSIARVIEAGQTQTV
ncbi:MAG TPA: L,D-transpeptidase family protein, partial [Thermoanaerobaculia bacterium]|nr:L,D-transpeptidase family protein [Thermoanaerobaculia bacterium]